MRRLSNISLIKHEGFGFVNMLGITVSVLVIGSGIYQLKVSD